MQLIWLDQECYIIKVYCWYNSKNQTNKWNDNAAQETLWLNTQSLLIINEECKQKIVDLLTPWSKVEYTNSELESLTCDTLYTCSA